MNDTGDPTKISQQPHTLDDMAVSKRARLRYSLDGAMSVAEGLAVLSAAARLFMEEENKRPPGHVVSLMCSEQKDGERRHQRVKRQERPGLLTFS